MAGRGRRGPGASLRGGAGRARGPPPPCPVRVGGPPYSAGRKPATTGRRESSCTTLFWIPLGAPGPFQKTGPPETKHVPYIVRDRSRPPQAAGSPSAPRFFENPWGVPGGSVCAVGGACLGRVCVVGVSWGCLSPGDPVPCHRAAPSHHHHTARVGPSSCPASTGVPMCPRVTTCVHGCPLYLCVPMLWLCRPCCPCPLCLLSSPPAAVPCCASCTVSTCIHAMSTCLCVSRCICVCPSVPASTCRAGPRVATICCPLGPCLRVFPCVHMSPRASMHTLPTCARRAMLPAAIPPAVPACMCPCPACLPSIRLSTIHLPSTYPYVYPPAHLPIHLPSICLLHLPYFEAPRPPRPARALQARPSGDRRALRRTGAPRRVVSPGGGRSATGHGAGARGRAGREAGCALRGGQRRAPGRGGAALPGRATAGLAARGGRSSRTGPPCSGPGASRVKLTCLTTV